VIDIEALATLPERELRSGFAEVVKHGLIADRSYFTLATSKRCVEWSREELVSIVYRSCEIKRLIVESDETEQGLRKTLNFGHSIGHAIEALYLRGEHHLTHGEAISIGMYGEAYISYRTGKISAEDLTIIENGLRATGLPTHLPTTTSTSELRELLSKDKKNVSGVVKWTLLEEIGRATFDVVVPEECIADALKFIQPNARGV
jgi:3-dehydroquinate synthase